MHTALQTARSQSSGHELAAQTLERRAGQEGTTLLTSLRPCLRRPPNLPAPGAPTCQNDTRTLDSKPPLSSCAWVQNITKAPAPRKVDAE